MSLSVLRKSIKSERGQIAIFVAFIFQVLFVFFAMVVNVGLLVHQKINLQNSVDLAAYYGAMKQAENLNAIAHINYQMRQSWKLMMFRYRQLGIAGDTTSHPWDSAGKTFRNGAQTEAPLGFRPSFCVAYSPFNFVGANESYCRNASGVNIPHIPSVSFAAVNAISNPFLSFQFSVGSAIDAANQSISRDCEAKSTINYWALARFIYGYKSDVVGRKKLLLKLANGMSTSADDFSDLEGESVREGVRRTLENNLTTQNRDGLAKDGLKFFNSMAAGDCRSNGNDLDAPGWMSEIFAFPLYVVMEGDCSAGVKLAPKIINSGTPGADTPRYQKDPFTKAIAELMPYVQEPDGNTAITRLYKTTLGYEKNPWCMSYVGVTAQSTPSIPFSPFGSVTITARAFAKPFGGRVGPWYKEKWSSSSNHSDQGKDIDLMVPPRVLPGQAPTNLNDPRMYGDYSRYVGDSIGTASKMTTGNIAKGLYAATYNNIFSMEWWSHLTDNKKFEPIGSTGDFLAWDGIANVAPGKMRDLEIAAIAPDQFDLTYYSVEPDFYRNYMVPLTKQEQKLGVNLRGDLGMRRDSQDARLRRFSVKDQIAGLNNSKILNTGSLTYVVQDFAELLTSFQAKSPREPALDSNRFGQCDPGGRIADDATPERATPGNCFSGGRVGYSVKIVDGGYLLRSDLELGGKGVTGSIKNPYPPSF